MGGHQFIFRSFNTRAVAGVLFQMIKSGKMKTRPVKKVAEKLMKYRPKPGPFFAFLQKRKSLCKNVCNPGGV